LLRDIAIGFYFFKEDKSMKETPNQTRKSIILCRGPTALPPPKKQQGGKTV